MQCGLECNDGNSLVVVGEIFFWNVWRVVCGGLTATSNLLCVMRCLMEMYLDSQSELYELGINWSFKLGKKVNQGRVNFRES